MVVAVWLVGRTGGPPINVVVGDGVWVLIVVLVVDPGGRAHKPLLAHTRSVWQQPPPKEVGHGFVSERHVRDTAEVVVVVVVGRGTGIITLVSIDVDVVVEVLEGNV